MKNTLKDLSKENKNKRWSPQLFAILCGFILIQLLILKAMGII